MNDLLQDNLIYLNTQKKEIFYKIDEYLNNNQTEKRFKLVWEGEFPNVTYLTKYGTNTIYDKNSNDIDEWIIEYNFLQQGKYDIVMYGLGLTYHLEKLIELNSDLYFYIIEPEIDLFLEALKVINIKQLLEHPQVRLLHLADNISDTNGFIYLKNLYSSNKRANIFLPFYLDAGKDSVTSFYEAEYRAVSIEAIEVGFEQNFGTLPYKNSIRNIEHIYRSNSLECLKNRFNNCTALIVGGGPSLEKDIEIIKRNKSKMLIVAAGSSIQSLLHHGIEPHLIVSMDPGEANGRVFENINTTGIPFVFMNQLYTDILNHRNGCNYHAFFSSDCIMNYFFGEQHLVPGFIPNPSVSGTATQIAIYLGASTIAYTGQDLSFPNKQYYASGATHVDLEVLEANMSTNTLKVENVQGNYNDTNYSLKVALEDIEELIKTLENITFINCSSMGAKIKGSDYKPLEEVIKSLGANEFDFDFDLIKKNTALIEEANKLTLEDLIGRIGDIETVCGLMTKNCNTSLKLIKRIDEVSRTKPNKAMSLLTELEIEFSKVTNDDFFKLIITQWNRRITRIYDQQVVRIEKEPTIIGKAKLLNEIVSPYINNILDSIREVKEEFNQLKTRLCSYKE